MLVPQPRQRARNANQLRIGMFSNQAISWPQFGQRERGLTTESSGQREMQTLRKEPMQAPTMKVTIRNVVSLTSWHRTEECQRQPLRSVTLQTDRSE